MIGAALIGEDGVRDVTTAPRNDAAAVAIGGKSWPLDIQLRPWVFRPRTDLLPMGFCCATLPVVTCALLQPTDRKVAAFKGFCRFQPAIVRSGHYGEVCEFFWAYVRVRTVFSPGRGR